MPSLITLLLLLSFLSFSTSSTLVDTDGDPIQNGKTYYILTPKGGLKYYATSTGPRCPVAITYEKKSQSSGTPIRISSPLRTLNIALEERVTLAFDSDLCQEKSLVWKVKSFATGRKAFITTGGDVGDRSFSISESNTPSSFTRYELKYWPSSDDGVTSSNVGFFSLFLGLTEISTPVWFEKAFEKKAFDNVLELPSTSILS